MYFINLQSYNNFKFKINKEELLLPYYNKEGLEAGTDEAGRGCLAGPVFAAAVILPRDFEHPALRDSKKLNEEQKETLFKLITKQAISYSVQKVSPRQIDRINILNASILAMHKSIDKLHVKPDHILVDGNRFKTYKKVPHTCIIKGDDKYYSIAAASVLAKVSRDRYMIKMSKRYPSYSWESNMGYPTKAHRAGIAEHGVTPLHRKSFKMLSGLDHADQLELFNR